MLDRRLLTTLLVAVLHTMTRCWNDDTFVSRESINVNVGKRIRIECELNNATVNGNRKGLWLRLEDAEVFFYATSRIHADPRFQVEQRSSLHMINSSTSSEIVTYALVIDDIRLTDSGTYSCQADNRIIKLFHLNVVERPFFVTNDLPTLLHTEAGRNVSIACEAQGKPEPQLSWLKKADEYHQKLIVNCSATPATCHLHLVDVNRWHHGIYECVATNSIGTIGRFYELDVHFPPEVHSPRDEVHHAVGEAMVIECLIDANPTPDIRWLHRYPTDVKQEIDLSRQFSQETFEHASDERVWYIKHEQLNATRWKSSLFIQRVPRRLMNSVFLCRAINRHGESEQPVHLIENHHYLKKYRHSTAPELPTTASATVDLLAELPDEFVNRSSRCTSSLFIFALLYILRLLPTATAALDTE